MAYFQDPFQASDLGIEPFQVFCIPAILVFHAAYATKMCIN